MPCTTLSVYCIRWCGDEVNILRGNMCTRAKPTTTLLLTHTHTHKHTHTHTFLLAGYKNAETFSFQDDVGQVVSRVCSLVPHGVLVFFPSYRLLDKVCDRWKSTGLWAKMEEYKTVITEPKGSNRNLFNQVGLMSQRGGLIEMLLQEGVSLFCF